MVRMAASEARKAFKATLRDAQAGERIILTHHGKEVAAIVPLKDLETLRLLEDRFDALAAREALAEVEREGTVSWEEAQAELGP